MSFKSQTNFCQLIFILVSWRYTNVFALVNDTKPAITNDLASNSCNKDCNSFTISSTATYYGCENSGDRDCIPTRHSICLYSSKSRCEWSSWGYSSGICPNVTESRTKIHYSLLDPSIDICSKLNTVQTCDIRMRCSEEKTSRTDMCSDSKDCNGISCFEIIRKSSCEIQILENVNRTSTKIISSNVTQISFKQKRNDHTVCIVNGNWSAWSGWKCSYCNKQCNNGTKECTRTRTCDNPKPKYGGKNCSGVSTQNEDRVCKLQPCPVNGNWNEWSRWMCGDCNGQCDGGNPSCTRTRKCDRPKPEYGGKNCSGQSAESEDRVCTLQPCPAYWSVWSEWKLCTNCSDVCGNGTTTCARTRQCISSGITQGSSQCEGENVQLDEFPCELKPCLAPEQESLSVVLPSVIGAIGGIISAVALIILLIFVTRRLKSVTNRNQNKTEMNDMGNTKDGEVTYEGFSSRRSTHVYGTLNESIDNNTTEHTSPIYQLAKGHESAALGKTEENYFTLEKDPAITEAFPSGIVQGTMTSITEQEMKPQDCDGGHYFALEKESENVTTNRDSNSIDYDYTTGNEIMIASNSNTDQTYHVLDNDIKYVDKTEKPEDTADNPEDSNYFILEKQ